MAAKNIEKNLGGMMDASLVERFTSQVDNQGGKIKRSLAAAVKLWIELPVEVQTQLLNQSLDANSLVCLVREIVEDHIGRGRKSARNIRSKKPGQKG